MGTKEDTVADLGCPTYVVVIINFQVVPRKNRHDVSFMQELLTLVLQCGVACPCSQPLTYKSLIYLAIIKIVASEFHSGARLPKASVEILMIVEYFPS